MNSKQLTRKLKFETLEGRRPLAADLLATVGGSESPEKNFSILQNNGQEWRMVADTETGFSPREIAVGQFTGDLLPDVAVASSDGKTIKVYENLGAGAFGNEEMIDVLGGGQFDEMVAADIDGNGRDDLLIGDFGNNRVLFVKNDQSDGWTDPVIFAEPNRVESVGFGDIDGDGDTDAYASVRDNGIRIFDNQNGSLVAAEYIENVPSRDVVFDDLDGDGKNDFIAVGSGTATIMYGATAGFGTPISIDLSPFSAQKVAVVGDSFAFIDTGQDSLVLMNKTGPRSFDIGDDISTGNNATDILVIGDSILVSNSNTLSRPQIQEFAMSGGELTLMHQFSPTANGPVYSLAVADIVEEQVSYELKVTDADGNSISSVTVGDEFFVRGFVEDVRAAPTGVFAAYLDVTFDPTLTSATSQVMHGDTFANVRDGEVLANEFDDAGGVATSTPTGSGAKLLFSVRMKADSAGTLTFSPNPADVLPRHHTLVYGNAEAVDAQAIVMRPATVEIAWGGWQNPYDALDVNNDGEVTPTDVVMLINELNSPQNSDATGKLSQSIDPPPFLDVDGDGYVAPIDVLRVINHINSQDPEGEGESPVTFVAPEYTRKPSILEANAVQSTAPPASRTTPTSAIARRMPAHDRTILDLTFGEIGDRSDDESLKIVLDLDFVDIR